MTVRGLDPLLAERRLSQQAPLSALAETRMGIDVTHYLRQILTHPSTREPLIAATGGLPIALTTHIEADLRALEQCRIKPVFVFNGLPLARRQLPRQAQEMIHQREAAQRNHAWALYEAGQAEESVRVLTEGQRHGNWVVPVEVTRAILRMFRHRMVEYIVAPYMQWGQLAYLLNHQKGYIHSVFASHEMLAFPTQRVITSIDLAGGTFTFVDKQKILADLAITHDQLIDYIVLSGTEMLSTFPPIAEQFFPRAVLDMIKHFRSGVGCIASHSEHPNVRASGYMESFLRVRAAIRYSLVLTAEEGTCLPLPLVIPPANASHAVTASDVPADIHEIFSGRLPDELYFHLSKGLISPQLVGWLTSGIIQEVPPLDNGESVEYRKYIENVITEGATAPRCTALALLTSCLNPAWQQKRLGAHYFFDPPHVNMQGHTINFTAPETKLLTDRCASWHVPCGTVEDELRRQNSSTIDFKLCLGATSTEDSAKRTKVSSGKASKPLEKRDEIVANVIWRFLDLRGLQNPNHTHTSLGKALYAGINASRVNDKFQEPLYLSLELARAGVLHGDLWSNRTYSGGPSFGTPSEMTSSLLFMRCLSIVPLVYRSQQWSGPLSRELLVFNSFVKSLTKSLRHLMEATSVHMFLRGDAKRQRDDFTDVALSLPFQGEVNTGFGVLAKVYIDATIAFYQGMPEGDPDHPDVKAAKEQAVEVVEDTFVIVKSPRAEIERGFRFWDALMVSIRTIAKLQGPEPSSLNTIVSGSVLDQFETADVWLRPFRP